MEKELAIEIVFPSREDVLLDNLNFSFRQMKNGKADNDHREDSEWIQEYELIYGSYILEF